MLVSAAINRLQCRPSLGCDGFDGFDGVTKSSMENYANISSITCFFRWGFIPTEYCSTWKEAITELTDRRKTKLKRHGIIQSECLMKTNRDFHWTRFRNFKLQKKKNLKWTVRKEMPERVHLSGAWCAIRTAQGTNQSVPFRHGSQIWWKFIRSSLVP